MVLTPLRAHKDTSFCVPVLANVKTRFTVHSSSQMENMILKTGRRIKNPILLGVVPCRALVREQWAYPLIPKESSAKNRLEWVSWLNAHQNLVKRLQTHKLRMVFVLQFPLATMKPAVNSYS